MKIDVSSIPQDNIIENKSLLLRTESCLSFRQTKYFNHRFRSSPFPLIEKEMKHININDNLVHCCSNKASQYAISLNSTKLVSASVQKPQNLYNNIASELPELFSLSKCSWFWHKKKNDTFRSLTDASNSLNKEQKQCLVRKIQFMSPIIFQNINVLEDMDICLRNRYPAYSA